MCRFNWYCAEVSRRIAIVMLVLSLASPALAQGFTFRKVADTDTPIPGGAGSFTGFYFPALDSGRVAFYGFQDANEALEGIYTDAFGLLTRVADSSMPLPDNPGEANFELQTALGAGVVVFQAFGDVDGVYLYRDGGLSVVADTNTQVPGTAGVFESFGFLDRPAVHNGEVVFVGEGPDLHSGVYRFAGGQLSVVADSDTPVPNQARNFESFEFKNVALHNGVVAFVGNQFDEPGIYLADSNGLHVIADTATNLPGELDETFFDFGSFFGGLDMDETAIGFVSESGVYRYDRSTGQIATIADVDSPIPGAGGEVYDLFFRTVSVSDGRVAFGYGDILAEGFGGPETVPFFGIYADLGGGLQKVVAVDDVLDGKAVSQAWLGVQGFRGDQIAFYATFADGSEGIYVATIIPEPASLALALIVTLTVCRGGLQRVAKRRGSETAWTIDSPG